MKRKLYLVAALCVLVLLTGLLAQTQHSVTLNWTASTTPSVTYNVYRSGTTGGAYSQISTGQVACCTFTDTLVSSGAKYYYVVRSFDGTSESANSNETSAVIPQGPQPPTSLTATVK